jgi:hypothetical protein
MWERNIEVLFRIAPELPALVVGDALRLQQVLLNLAGNAIKFTERGEVVVSAQLVAQEAGTLSIAFAIRDTGIGISAEQCEHIFDGFSQAEASTARRYGGTGLGLAISQRLVQLMGGTLRVVSELGHGSVFDFTIALGVPEQAAERRPPPGGRCRRRRCGLTCLVVDDNPVARTVLREMAASFGWRVDLAADGLKRWTRSAPSRRGARRMTWCSSTGACRGWMAGKPAAASAGGAGRQAAADRDGDGA